MKAWARVSGFSLLVLASANGVGAEGSFTGRVGSVHGDDTLGVLRDGREVRVRLYGVDAPELGQAHGSTAKQFTSQRVFGKTVTVKELEQDRYGRTISQVSVGPESLRLQLVQSGNAWWYHWYAPKDRELALAEIEARAERRGLWADRSPTPPWAFRKERAPVAPEGTVPPVTRTPGNPREP